MNDEKEFWQAMKYTAVFLGGVLTFGMAAAGCGWLVMKLFQV
jgi:hypothetical protein